MYKFGLWLDDIPAMSFDYLEIGESDVDYTRREKTPYKRVFCKRR